MQYINVIGYIRINFCISPYILPCFINQPFKHDKVARRQYRLSTMVNCNWVLLRAKNSNRHHKYFLFLTSKCDQTMSPCRLPLRIFHHTHRRPVIASRLQIRKRIVFVDSSNYPQASLAANNGRSSGNNLGIVSTVSHQRGQVSLPLPVFLRPSPSYVWYPSITPPRC